MHEVFYHENGIVPFERGLAELEREVERFADIQGREIGTKEGNKYAKITYKPRVNMVK